MPFQILKNKLILVKKNFFTKMLIKVVSEEEHSKFDLSVL